MCETRHASCGMECVAWPTRRARANHSREQAARGRGAPPPRNRRIRNLNPRSLAPGLEKTIRVSPKRTSFCLATIISMCKHDSAVVGSAVAQLRERGCAIITREAVQGRACHFQGRVCQIQGRQYAGYKGPGVHSCTSPGAKLRRWCASTCRPRRDNRQSEAGRPSPKERAIIGKACAVFVAVWLPNPPARAAGPARWSGARARTLREDSRALLQGARQASPAAGNCAGSPNSNQNVALLCYAMLHCVWHRHVCICACASWRPGRSRWR